MELPGWKLSGHTSVTQVLYQINTQKHEKALRDIMTDAVMVPGGGGQERGKNTVRAHISCKLYTLSVAPPEVDDFGHYRK